MPNDLGGAALDRLKTRLKARVVDAVAGPPGQPPKMNGQELEPYLRQAFRSVVEEARTPRPSPDEETRLIREVVEEMVGLGPLGPLLSDPSVIEIMVNGPREIFVERHGAMERVPGQFRDAEHLMTVIERLLGQAGGTVNESSPVCDATLPDGSRINVIVPPLVLNGPTVTIRRKQRSWSMEDYVSAFALSGPAAEFLKACIQAKVNCVIAGGTSTGKTTLVTILSSFIPPQERIITIENVAELSLPNRQQWIRLVARSTSLEGRGEIPMRALVRNALRMRPDRIILGEARGGEALDVVQAMHTGHEGVITVLHANSAQTALERLETMMLMSGLELPPQACRTQIASAVDLVIQMGRFADGTRRIMAMTQVLGATAEGFQLQDLFTFDVASGASRYTGARPKFLHKFQLNNVAVPSWIASA